RVRGAGGGRAADRRRRLPAAAPRLHRRGAPRRRAPPALAADRGQRERRPGASRAGRPGSALGGVARCSALGRNAEDAETAEVASASSAFPPSAERRAVRESCGRIAVGSWLPALEWYVSAPPASCVSRITNICTIRAQTGGGMQRVM